jgi:hypothetical protein
MDCVVSLMKSERCQVRPVPLNNPLNEVARSKPYRRDDPVFNVGPTSLSAS